MGHRKKAPASPEAREGKALLNVISHAWQRGKSCCPVLYIPIWATICHGDKSHLQCIEFTWASFLIWTWIKNKVTDTSLELLRPNFQGLLVSKAHPSNHWKLLSPSLLVLSYLTHFSFYTPSRTMHTWVSKCWTRIRFLKYHLNNTTLLLKNLHELLIAEENCQ